MTSKIVNDNIIATLKKKVTALETAFREMRNERIVTLPIRQASNLPTEAGEGELALGDDGLAYKFQGGVWTPVSGAGGNSIIFNSPGILSVFGGTSRYYPLRAGSISQTHVALGGTAPSNPGVIVQLRKNGVTVASGTVAASTLTTIMTVSDPDFEVGDFFTIAVTQVGIGNPGGYLVVQIVLGV